MDTLLQDLRSALETLGGYHAFTVAAVSLGLGLQGGPVRGGPAPRPVHHPAPAAAHHAPPHRNISWMDYIDFRRGSGDVLRWIGPTTLTDEPDRPARPHTCGSGE